MFHGLGLAAPPPALALPDILPHPTSDPHPRPHLGKGVRVPQRPFAVPGSSLLVSSLLISSLRLSSHMHVHA